MADPFGHEDWNDLVLTELVELARNGCQESQEKLFVQFRNYLAYIANDQADPKLNAKFGVSDIVQQTFVKVIEGFDNFKGTTAAEFKGWLRTITINEARQTRRGYTADKRQVTREQNIAEDSQTSGVKIQLPDRFLTPGTNAIAEEEAEALKKTLETLPEKYRDVIRMRNWEGLKFHEIAERLEITEGSAAKLWYRGLIKLQEQYSKNSQS